MLFTPIATVGINRCNYRNLGENPPFPFGSTVETLTADRVIHINVGERQIRVGPALFPPATLIDPDHGRRSG